MGQGWLSAEDGPERGDPDPWLAVRASKQLTFSEASVNRNRIKDAHRRMMIANHPDRGGSPYLASSTFLYALTLEINEAKDLLDRTTSR